MTITDGSSNVATSSVTLDGVQRIFQFIEPVFGLYQP
jgi:hypothetical protein